MCNSDISPQPPVSDYSRLRHRSNPSMPVNGKGLSSASPRSIFYIRTFRLAPSRSRSGQGVGPSHSQWSEGPTLTRGSVWGSGGGCEGS